MPDYKQRRIELTPRKHSDGTWHCPYRIIEFRQTCWRFHKGCADGFFSSREEAATAALEEAKRIVDSLEPPIEASLSEPSSLGRTYGKRVNSLMFNSFRSLFCIGDLVLRKVILFPNWRKIYSTITVSAWSRRQLWRLARRNKRDTSVKSTVIRLL